MNWEEYNRRSDAFVKEMLEKNPVAEDLKEAAIGYWERIFSEESFPRTEEEKKIAEERRKKVELYGKLIEEYGEEEADRRILKILREERKGKKIEY